MLLMAVAMLLIAAAMGQYTLRPVQARQKAVKSFFPVNDMYLGTVPVQQGLSQAEEKLIAEGCPLPFYMFYMNTFP